jgi:hypothetical protein
LWGFVFTEFALEDGRGCRNNVCGNPSAQFRRKIKNIRESAVIIPARQFQPLNPKLSRRSQAFKEA